VHGRSMCRSTSIVDPSAGECLARGTPTFFAWRMLYPKVPRSQSLRGEQRPRQKSTPRSRWPQGVHLGEKGPAPCGTQAPAKSPPRLSEIRDKISDPLRRERDPKHHALWRAHTAAFSPPRLESRADLDRPFEMV
jgi:hypothetical protein